MSSEIEHGKKFIENLASALQAQAHDLRVVSETLARIASNTELASRQMQGWLYEYEIRENGGVRH